MASSLPVIAKRTSPTPVLIIRQVWPGIVMIPDFFHIQRQDQCQTICRLFKVRD